MEERPAVRWCVAVCWAWSPRDRCHAGSTPQAAPASTREPDGDRKGDRIDRGILQERHAERLEAGQRARRPDRQRNANQRACCGEQEALGQRLLDQVTSACPEGDSHGKLLPADVDSGEQQVRQVHARDCQDAGHRTRQHVERLPEAPSQRIVEAADARTERAAIVDRPLESLADDTEIRLRAFGRRVRLQAADREERVAPSCGFRCDRERRDQVDLGPRREDGVEVEVRRQHAHDGERRVVRRERCVR